MLFSIYAMIILNGNLVNTSQKKILIKDIEQKTVHSFYI